MGVGIAVCTVHEQHAVMSIYLSIYLYCEIQLTERN